MAIHLDGVVFLRIPRAGSHFLEDALTDLGIQFRHEGKPHDCLPPAHIRKTISRKFAVFVRHPFDWWMSIFVYQTVIGWSTRHWRSNEEIAMLDCEADTFSGFLKNVLKKRPGFFSQYSGRFIDDSVLVGRLENINTDLPMILRQAGHDVPTEIATERNHGVSSGIVSRKREVMKKARNEPLGSLKTDLANAERSLIEKYYTY